MSFTAGQQSEAVQVFQVVPFSTLPRYQDGCSANVSVLRHANRLLSRCRALPRTVGQRLWRGYESCATGTMASSSTSSEFYMVSVLYMYRVTYLDAADVDVAPYYMTVRRSPTSLPTGVHTNTMFRCRSLLPLLRCTEVAMCRSGSEERRDTYCFDLDG